MYRYLLTLAVLYQVSIVFSDTNYRLNTPMKPKAYSIAITPYFDTNDTNTFTFDGEVDITFTTESVTKQIKLHSEDLIYDDANIRVLNGASIVQLNESNPLVFDTNYTFAFINLKTDLLIGVEYSLKISYRGPIRDDYNGFYRIHYFEGGIIKWLGATQMEATHARKVFPCFDEPELRATFSLSIDRPQNYEPSLSNTKLKTSEPLANGFIRDVFHPTPIMSTYLVAFVVSELVRTESVNGTKEFSIYTRREALNQTDCVLEFGMKVVDALGDYFGIDYYSTDTNMKLSYVALPDFTQNSNQSLAMENWGLVLCKESLLLNVSEDVNYKYEIAELMAHEITHMWFGNLVTCHWWSDLWLKEGFAKYFQYYIIALVAPEVLASDIVISCVYNMYDSDYPDDPDPLISNPNVNSPDDIAHHFNYKVYAKACTVIRMMHHFIGDAAFRIGLNIYLKTNKYSSSNPDKLYDALNIGVQNATSLTLFPNTSIGEVMTSWITQAGYPVLQVDINYDDDSVTLTQKRFYSNSSYASNETYVIPITYTTGVNPDFTNTKPVMVMKNRTHQFSIPGISQDRRWVIFNIQETGIYRVNYDNQTWDSIVLALKGSDREKIHPYNRAKIVNDLFALYEAGEVPLNRLHDVVDFMSAETDYLVWHAVLGRMVMMLKAYENTTKWNFFAANARRLFDMEINNVGYDVRANDTNMLKRQLQIMKYACNMHHPGCIDHHVKLFRGLKENGTEITASLRSSAYSFGLEYGDKQDCEFLRERASTTSVVREYILIKEKLKLACSNATSV